MAKFIQFGKKVPMSALLQAAEPPVKAVLAKVEAVLPVTAKVVETVVEAVAEQAKEELKDVNLSVSVEVGLEKENTEEQPKAEDGESKLSGIEEKLSALAKEIKEKAKKKRIGHSEDK